MNPVRRTHGRLVEVDTLGRFDALLDAGATSMSGWRLRDVDLRDRSTQLRSLAATGALLLGCELLAEDEELLRDRGALLFPDVPGVPVNPYRSELYTPAELYDGVDEGYDHTLDARVYAWSRRSGDGEADVAAALAETLHDHAVDEALASFVEGRRLVGVMGGHALPRGSQGYAEAARLGRALAGTGLVVATGGGPGAMEAANLGARTAALPEAALTSALRRLGAVPGFEPSVTAWAQTAMAVLDDLPGGREGRDVAPRTLGIPTWFYGHEPPGAFATDIAKFFRNALREDLLLQVCTGGIVFLPGAAGTVQEIFQDACENYYADEVARAPMVLVGREHWTRTLPAWPLLQRLAEHRGFVDRVALVDTVDEVLGVLAATGATAGA
jgi:predicted Rossmann-fold nucleotide-binding protein